MEIWGNIYSFTDKRSLTASLTILKVSIRTSSSMRGKNERDSQGPFTILIFKNVLMDFWLVP
jgi:hypothetical protein